ncbi:IclR family transcriptional regulator [Plastoroseomonas hellenica]|uniref:IclR family transcriptional regulator n=1 Tax=Plastoroseomonas hellenica TaxID=2687306 RepID=UPI001BACCD9B|nr:helix-turn-helix domain-containing protein [Plastoroseomonas hellenica]
MEASPDVLERRPPAGVLDRAFAVLGCFSESRLRLHLRDFAQATSLDKATLLRLLGTLARHGYVQREEDGRYAPGPTPLRLGALYRATSDLSTRMPAVLQRVMQQTRESAAFYTRNGGDRVCLFRVNARRELRHHVEVGDHVPLAEGGSSVHVLLAHTGGSTPLAAAVLARGYAITRAERTPELASVSVPVFEGDGAFLGALAVVGLGSRLTDAALLAAVDIAANELRAQGFFPRPPSPDSA